MTYKKQARETVSNILEKKLGITYEEFDKLDFDEQQKLFEQMRRKTKIRNYEIVMIGSGENALFVKVKHGEDFMLPDGTIVSAGETPEESRMKLEDDLDDIMYSKPVAFVKKIGRRINKKY